MSPAEAGVVLAAALCGRLLAGPLARSALRAGFADRPGGHKGHAAPVALAGFLHALPVLGPLLAGASWGLVLGAQGVLALGLAEDLAKARGREIPWPLRLLGLLLASALPVLSGELPAGAGALLAASAIAFNWFDHADGLCAAAALGPMAVLAAGPAPELLVPAGLLLGFLFANAWRPAGPLLFLGDTGAQVLGWALPALAWRAAPAAGLPELRLALAVALLPLADAAGVTLLRLRQGHPPWEPDRERHLGHRLAARGWSRGGAALLVLTLAAGLTLPALL